MTEPRAERDASTPAEPVPQTGDPVVDEVLAAVSATTGSDLGEQTDVALQAQRRLQERLSESRPGGGAGNPDAPPA